MADHDTLSAVQALQEKLLNAIGGLTSEVARTNERISRFKGVFEALDSRLSSIESGLETVARDAAQSRDTIHKTLSSVTAIGVFLDVLVAELDERGLKNTRVEKAQKDWHSVVSSS